MLYHMYVHDSSKKDVLDLKFVSRLSTQLFVLHWFSVKTYQLMIITVK